MSKRNTDMFGEAAVADPAGKHWWVSVKVGLKQVFFYGKFQTWSKKRENTAGGNTK